MVATVRLPGPSLLPLLRACAISLTVEGQKLLQEKAVRLLVAAFKAHPAQVGLPQGEVRHAAEHAAACARRPHVRVQPRSARGVASCPVLRCLHASVALVGLLF